MYVFLKDIEKKRDIQGIRSISWRRECVYL